VNIESGMPLELEHTNNAFISILLTRVTIIIVTIIITGLKSIAVFYLSYIIAFLVKPSTSDAVLSGKTSTLSLLSLST
jgi:hypothetical protein